MHEYKVVPAPARPAKVRGVKSPAERYAHGLAEVLNRHAEDGWDFVRSETFTVEEPRGWFGKTVTVTRTVLILCRRRDEAEPAYAAEAPAEPAFRPEPRPDPRSAQPERAEPIFRPGATLRAEGARKYPPLRQSDPAQDGPGEPG